MPLVPRPALVAAVALAVLAGCSPRRLAVHALGNALAGSTSSPVWTGDDDPELVGEALPFALKTIESLAAEAPRHRGLRLAAASGFAQYAFAYVQQKADFIEASDLSRATHLRARAKRLYLRAARHGFAGFEVDHPGLRHRLEADPAGAPGALAWARRDDVPLLYWTAAAWGAAISLAKNEAELSANLPAVEAMLRRALDLDESFELGAIHEALAAVEAGGAATGAGSVEAARRHLERAVAFSQNRRAGAHVSVAELLAVPAQDRAAFRAALEAALAIDPEAAPERRLANLVLQERARWLLQRQDELFVE